MSENFSIPKFTVLSDHSEEKNFVEEVSQLFMFESRLTPMLDIIRHKDTTPPLSMALYGSAGAGKSSALKWLMGRLEEWNQHSPKERCGHPRVLMVRFTPYKYTTTDGLLENVVSEIILQCLPLLNPAWSKSKAECLIAVLEHFGSVLGQPFLLRIEELSIQWDVAEELNPVLQQITLRRAEPDVFLKRLYELLERWTKAAEHQNDPVRLVVMVRGIDQCLPEVMLAMLAIIHKQIRVKQILFFATMDAVRVQAHVRRHFTNQGDSEDQIQHYLSMVFDVETRMEPSAEQVKRFYDQRVGDLNRKTDNMLSNNLSATYKSYIDEAVLHLSGTNLRTITQLLNGALMRGYSASLLAEQQTEKGCDSQFFARSIQVYLLQRWLSFFSVGEATIYRNDVLQWFLLLSEEACKPDASFSQVENQTLGKSVSVDQYGRSLRRYASDPEPVDRFAPPDGLSFNMIHEWVWNLLKIPFNCDAVSYLETEDLELETEAPADGTVKHLLVKTSTGLRDALAAALEKPVTLLADDDASMVVNLDLSGQQLTADDLAFVGGLEKLVRLDLHNSSIENVDWISGLTHLKTLNLTCTNVVDVTILGTLTGLEMLDLSYTQITDLTPLGELTSLKSLVLYGSPIQDISALKKMAKLERVNLSHTAVGDDDIVALEELTQLQAVYLKQTKLSPARIGKLKQVLGFDVLLQA